MPQRHLSSGTDTTRVVLLRTLLILTIVCGLVFVAVNLHNGENLLGLAEAGMGALAAVIFWLQARGHIRTDFAIRAYLLPFFIVMMLALIRAPDMSVFVWAFMLPALSHLLLGRKLGSLVAVVFLLLALAIFVWRFHAFSGVSGPEPLLNGALCLASLFVLSFAHEWSRSAAEMRLRERADLDTLTHLASRHRIQELFEQARDAARHANAREPLQATLIMLDLDHFKQINDTHGHEAGDKVLAAIAARLLTQCRADDRIGRLGGEEIVILMFGLAHQDAVGRAEQLCHNVRVDPVAYRDCQITVTASMGVATFNLTDTDFSDACSLADARLYEAKAQGRDRVVG